MAYYIAGTITLGVWAKKSGSWSKISNKVIYITQVVSTSGANTYNWDATWDADLGTGVQAFGVTVESVSGSGASGALAAVLTDFVSVAWQATTTSGDRSATPSSQLSKVTVRPQ